MEAIVHVALQEGFDAELVAVTINRAEIFRKEEVTTDLRIGLADSFETPIQEGPITIEVHLPKRNISGSIDVQFASSVYVAVSKRAGSIQFKVSDHPFGYV